MLIVMRVSFLVIGVCLSRAVLSASLIDGEEDGKITAAAATEEDPFS
jgi:hypothetical protein